MYCRVSSMILGLALSMNGNVAALAGFVLG
jgi:hypothetical protein